VPCRSVSVSLILKQPIRFWYPAGSPAARIGGPSPRDGRGPLGRFRPQPNLGIEPRDRGSTPCAEPLSDLRSQFAPNLLAIKQVRGGETLRSPLTLSQRRSRAPLPLRAVAAPPFPT
jgi:hypothetical protein